MSSQVVSHNFVQRVEQDVSQLREAFPELTLREARRRLQEIESEIEGLRGDIGFLEASQSQKMGGAYATLLALKERLEQKELGNLLAGCDLVLASGRAYGDERGTAPGSIIVGKALVGMLEGTLNSQEAVDRVLRKGSNLYDKLAYGQSLGAHLPWEETVVFFGKSLSPKGGVMESSLTVGGERAAYLDVLRQLREQVEGKPIGALLKVGQDYFGVMVGAGDICLFDPNGKVAPALMIKTDSIEKAADILASRRGATQRETMTYYPVESKVVGDLAIAAPAQFPDIPLTPTQEFEPVLTGTNRSDVVRLIRELERVGPEEVEAVLSRYPTVKLSRKLDTGVDIKAAVLALKAELYFHEAELLAPSDVEEGELSDEEDVVFYDCEDAFPETRELRLAQKRELTARASEVGTLFIRDHVLPQIVKEEAVDQTAIIENVEMWFQSFLPTLFFGEGVEGKTNLALATSSLHSVTAFLKDYNTARGAVEGTRGGWRCRRRTLSPAELNTRIHDQMTHGKESEMAILKTFCGHLVDLFEAKQGKQISGPLKGRLQDHTAAVLNALIDTVLSPEFAKMMVLGFIHDDQMSEELKSLPEREEGTPGEVPQDLHHEVTAFVNELIDFGSPRYSSWIASSMLKTHFVQTDHPGVTKSVLRFGMRMLSKPLFRDEIGAFLRQAFSLQTHQAAQSEQWVATATVAVGALRRYGWDDTGKSLKGRVQEVADIPQALFQKISGLAREMGSRKTGALLSVTSWVMPSVHTFGQDLAGNLYGLSQSKPLMRTLTIRYLIQGTLIPEVRTQLGACVIPPAPPIAPQGPQDLSMEAGRQMSNLLGNYLETYVGELYLKETPLVTSVVDLSVVMVKNFLPEMIGKPQQGTLPKAKQQMIVDVYGSVGSFIHDYALAVQEAKKDEAFEVYASEGREEVLVLGALERVRGKPLRISDQDVQKKLEAMTDIIVRSHCKGISPVQAQLVRSTSFVIPKVVKAAVDLLFSPEMMCALVVGMIQDHQGPPLEDPHHQYQSWDQEVLMRWNDSLFNLMKGVVQLGEPSGKMEAVIQSVLGISDGAQQSLGSLLARFSAGPSPFMAPASTLQTIATLEKMLFDDLQRPKMTRIFDQSDRKERETALREQLTGLMTDPLPMEALRKQAEGYVGQTVQGLMEFGHSAVGHLGTLSSIVSQQSMVSSEGPLVRALKQEVQQRSATFLKFLSPSGEKALQGGLQGLLQDKLSEALDLKEFAMGKNPIVEYLDTTCSNIISFFNSPRLMRAYVYNYVLTPEFFRHMIENLDGAEVFAGEKGLARQLPSSLFLDMCSLSWVLPGSGRSPRLLEAPKMEGGLCFAPPSPSEDREGCIAALDQEIKGTERLFAGVEASPMLNSLLEKLHAWEKGGITTPEFTAGCLNHLEDIPAFTEHLTQWIDVRRDISPEEAVALRNACEAGEFPFVFRYLDVMLSEATPMMLEVFGSHPKESLREEFLREAATGLNGATVQRVEKMQLVKSFDFWLIPLLQENEPATRKVKAVFKLLLEQERELSFKDQMSFLVEKIGACVEAEGTEALFIIELGKCFKESEDPLREAMQLFSMYRGVMFWREKTERIHETLGALRLEGSSSASVLADFEPQLKRFYQNLGMMLSEGLKAPFSDKLKLGIAGEFLTRYRSFSHSVAPKQGERVSNACSGVITVNSSGGNHHKLLLLEKAQKSVVMSGCYFGGTLFDRALEIIEHGLATKKDFDVKLIGSDHMLTRENREKITTLEERYPDRFYMLVTSEVQLYTSPISDRTSYRTNHSKLLVIDYGKYFEMGGSGIADRWGTAGDTPMASSKREITPLAFRDSDFLFRSEDTFGVGYALYLELLSLFPVWKTQDVKERIQASFDPRFNHVVPPSFEGARADNVDGHGGLRAIGKATFYSTGPDDRKNPMLKDLIDDISRATDSIYIQHMYFHPVPELLEALQGAAAKGVSIHLVTNRSGVDMPLTHELFTELSRANWKQLLDGEAKPHLHLYEFGVANTTYHKKIITIDEKTVYLGSTNLGEKSLRMNDHEINVRMESPAMAALVFNVFQQDTQSRGSEGPMAPEVPQREVLSTEINRAAIAEVQSSLLQRWL